MVFSTEQSYNIPLLTLESLVTIVDNSNIELSVHQKRGVILSVYPLLLR